MPVEMLQLIPGVKHLAAQLREDSLMVIDGSDRFDCFPAGYLTCCMTACAVCEQVELSQLCTKCLVWWFIQSDGIFIALAHAPSVRAPCSTDAQLHFTG